MNLLKVIVLSIAAQLLSALAARASERKKESGVYRNNHDPNLGKD